jgi:GalNAc-alpha-(1->4)-GalNAc-alpha-(1->3)-diNAcBac-PP-undecaprenol alpha-1,4-N-acetyl-D-galactosaminyltransferase
MGRLAPQKRFDVLLRAFARIAPRYPDWNLRIVGNGPERGRLEVSATKLGVDSQVSA